MYSAEICDVSLHLEEENSIRCIQYVIFVPNLNSNLISISKGFVIVFCKEGVLFMRADDCSISGEFLMTTAPSNGIYKLQSNVPEIALSTSTNTSNSLWHRRSWHLCRYGITKVKANEVCTACLEGKQTCAPFKRIKSKRATQLVHSDVCGPFSGESLEGNKYMLVFVDDYTSMLFVYFIK